MRADTAPRSEQVRSIILARKAQLERLPRSRPCSGCVYLAKRDGYIAPYCGHLALTRQQFEPVSGKVVEALEVEAAKARAADGLCGPEGLLFEGRRYQFLRFLARNANLFLWLTAMWFLSGFVFWSIAAPQILR